MFNIRIHKKNICITFVNANVKKTQYRWIARKSTTKRRRSTSERLKASSKKMHDTSVVEDNHNKNYLRKRQRPVHTSGTKPQPCAPLTST